MTKAPGTVNFDPTDIAARVARLESLVAGEPRVIAQKGETFINEGDREVSLIYIASGTVQTYVSRGERELVFGTYEAGESFGELTLHGEPRNTSIRAVTETEYVLVSQRNVLSYIGQCPEFALDLLQRATTRARVITARARSLALNDTYGRLSELLQNLADKEQSNQPLIRITHQEIASQIGCTREMVTRLLRDLETGKIIRTSRGRVQLLRPLPDAW